MKKSKMYQLAAIAVMESNSLSDQDKLTILRELLEREDLSIFVEEQKEKENES